MEDKTRLIVPLMAFWSSPKVREHIVSAGRELALAIGAGLQELQSQATASGMQAQYPYLESALGNLQGTLEGWATQWGEPAQPVKKPRRRATKPKPTKRGKKNATH